MFNHFEAYTIDELYSVVADRFRSRGTLVSPRGMTTKELAPATLNLKLPHANVLTNEDRKPSKSFMAAEMLWIMMAKQELAMLEFYNKNMAKFSDDGRKLSGAYGPRIIPQFVYVHDLLVKDPDSRQAVITIWTPNPAPSKDIPCTVMMQFLVRHGKLDLFVYMRSNDFWLGLPYDIHNFTCIQIVLAKLLRVELGQYYHMVGSLHLYQEHFDKVNFMKKHSSSIMTPDPTFRCWHDWQTTLIKADQMEGNIRAGDFSDDLSYRLIDTFPDPFYKQKLLWLFEKARQQHAHSNS